MKPYYEHGGVTIYHGDCRELLPPAGVHLVLTDPPYGIALGSNGSKLFRSISITGDEDRVCTEYVLDRLADRPLIAFATPMYPWPGLWRQFLIWDKGEAVGSGGDPGTCWRLDYELIQVARVPEVFGRRDSSILRFPVRPFLPEMDFRFHPAQKPTALLGYLIRKTTHEGQCVFDPFMGSGSVLVAAKNHGRRAVGIEIEEKYCETAALRLSQEVMQFTESGT